MIQGLRYRRRPRAGDFHNNLGYSGAQSEIIQAFIAVDPSTSSMGIPLFVSLNHPFRPESGSDFNNGMSLPPTMPSPRRTIILALMTRSCFPCQDCTCRALPCGYARHCHWCSNLAHYYSRIQASSGCTIPEREHIPRVISRVLVKSSSALLAMAVSGPTWPLIPAGHYLQAMTRSS